VSAIAAQVVLAEVGPDVSRFRNASAFASWLGLCPDKRISGGKVLSTKTRKVKNRVAIVLRLGAKSLSRAQDYFGAFFRRMRARLGTAQAITATAHNPSLLAGIPTLTRIAAWGGGFPIKVDGELVGTIGLSGAPTVQNDVDCARAALALVSDAVPVG